MTATSSSSDFFPLGRVVRITRKTIVIVSLPLSGCFFGSSTFSVPLCSFRLFAALFRSSLTHPVRCFPRQKSRPTICHRSSAAITAVPRRILNSPLSCLSAGSRFIRLPRLRLFFGSLSFPFRLIQRLHSNACRFPPRCELHGSRKGSLRTRKRRFSKTRNRIAVSTLGDHPGPEHNLRISRDCELGHSR